METNQARRLPIVDANDHLVGLLSLADIAREATHERGWWSKEVKADVIGEALEAICEPRSSPRDLVPTACGDAPGGAGCRWPSVLRGSVPPADRLSVAQLSPNALRVLAARYRRRARLTPRAT